MDNCIYFDKAKYKIEQYSDEKFLKPLRECIETIAIYKEEKPRDNQYRFLAENFKKYKANNKYTEETDDWYFYKYLESLDNHHQYKFPLENGDFITVNIGLLNPYESETGIINPRWHLLVSWFAYMDAAYNHFDNEYASKIMYIKAKPNTPCHCKSLKKWEEESIKKFKL